MHWVVGNVVNTVAHRPIFFKAFIGPYGPLQKKAKKPNYSPNRRVLGAKYIAK